MLFEVDESGFGRIFAPEVVLLFAVQFRTQPFPYESDIIISFVTRMFAVMAHQRSREGEANFRLHFYDCILLQMCSEFLIPVSDPIPRFPEGRPSLGTEFPQRCRAATLPGHIPGTWSFVRNPFRFRD